MKILYAIQGTGNGHLSRAKEVIPALMNRTRVDIVVSGTQSEVELPFPVKYKFKGISFVFGKNGQLEILWDAFIKVLKSTIIHENFGSPMLFKSNYTFLF